MLGRMSVFCPLTSDHSYAMPATKYLSKPKKLYPKPWFSLPKHVFPGQNLLSAADMLTAVRMAAVRIYCGEVLTRKTMFWQGKLYFWMETS